LCPAGLFAGRPCAAALPLLVFTFGLQQPRLQLVQWCQQRGILLGMLPVPLQACSNNSGKSCKACPAPSSFPTHANEDMYKVCPACFRPSASVSKKWQPRQASKKACKRPQCIGGSRACTPSCGKPSQSIKCVHGPGGTQRAGWPRTSALARSACLGAAPLAAARRNRGCARARKLAMQYAGEEACPSANRTQYDNNGRAHLCVYVTTLRYMAHVDRHERHFGRMK